MKRTLIIALASVAFSSAAMAQSQFFLAGSWQSPTQWVNNANPMNDLGGDHHQLVLSGLGANAVYETKVTDGTWDVTFPNSNKRIVSDATGGVTVDFWNKATFGDGWIEDGPRIGFSIDPTMNIDFIGSTADFTSWGSGIAMTNMGSGMHMGLVDITATGNVEFKFRQAGTWGAFEYGASGGLDNINYDFTSTGQYKLSLDVPNGRYNVEAVPEPASMTILGGIAALAAFKRRKK